MCMHGPATCGSCRPGLTTPAPGPTPGSAHPSASMRGTALTSRHRLCGVGCLLATNDSSWPGSGCSPLITLQPQHAAVGVQECMHSQALGVPEQCRARRSCATEGEVPLGGGGTGVC